MLSSLLCRGKRTALFFFHPECEFCRKELEGILEHRDEFSNVQWVFLTLAPEELTATFLQDYPLESIPNANVLRQEAPDTYLLYKIKGPPAVFIYSEDGILLNQHLGATPISVLIEELK